MKKKLYISQIDDIYVQQNFKAIGEIFSTIPFIKGTWQFCVFTVKTTGSNIKIPHGLGFQPKDILVTSTIGGTVTYNYSLFDRTYLDVDATVVTSPITVRAFVGTYSEETINV